MRVGCNVADVKHGVSYNTVGIKLSIQIKVKTNFNGDGVKCDLMCRKCGWVAMQLVDHIWFVLTYQTQIQIPNTCGL